MKINLFNIGDFIVLNDLKEISNAVLFQRGNVPHPDGLVSNEIFGTTTKSRKETFAYIDLKSYFLHPHIYKVIKRLYRNIDKIIDGSLYVSIGKDGKLTPDENGDTGLQFLYDVWDRINWGERNGETGMRNERIELLNRTKRDVAFMKYQLVIPAFYRDVTLSANGGGGQTDDLNKLYGKLIRLCKLVDDKGLFDFQFNSANFNIQQTIIDIYDYFKVKLDKKNGLIRKYLMGKNVDYCSRTVITAPNYHANTIKELGPSLMWITVPISQVCALCKPFISRWLKSFFERELIDNKEAKILFNPETGKVESVLKLKSPASYFNDKYIDKMIKLYIKDQEARFNFIEVPVEGTSKKYYLRMTGQKTEEGNTSEISTIANRPMTITDLLFLACSDVIKGKHGIITRYPLLDEFGMVFGKLRLSSTVKTCTVNINGEIFDSYPVIDLNCPENEIGAEFVDSLTFSNSCLPGLDGDYDGDQITLKILFTEEANADCDRVLHSKSYFISSDGKNIRKVETEPIQAFYTMTKNPTDKDRTLSPEEVRKFVSYKPTDITFEMLTDWLADTLDESTGKIKKSPYNCTDKFTITPKDFPTVKEPTETTLGRFLFNKILLEGSGIVHTPYVNHVLFDSAYSKIEQIAIDALKDDIITVDQMYTFVDTRDWLGFQLHGIICTSFTMETLIVPNEVVKLKKELLKKYKTELENNDPKVAEEIEKALIDKTMETLSDNVGMDLYISGTRGSVGNNYKNIYLMRGATVNPATGKTEVITNSLMEGMTQKDICSGSNIILSGAYPKSVK